MSGNLNDASLSKSPKRVQFSKDIHIFKDGREETKGELSSTIVSNQQSSGAKYPTKKKTAKGVKKGMKKAKQERS